jgi:hypothetical protein
MTTITGKKVYISGAMTGIPEFNFPTFNKVAELLRQDGAIVFNPAESFEGRTDLPRHEYMREDIKQLLDAEAIMMIEGWHESKGACLELEIAKEINIPLYAWNKDTPNIFFNLELNEVAPTPPRENENGEAAPAIALESHPISEEEWQDLGRPTIDEIKANHPSAGESVPLPHREAESLVLGDRQSSYGHPLDNFSANAHMWTGTLYYKLKAGEVITPEDVALLMTQVKIAREINVPKRDNLVDAHGYLMTYQMVKNEAIKRGLI